MVLLLSHTPKISASVAPRISRQLSMCPISCLVRALLCLASNDGFAARRREGVRCEQNRKMALPPYRVTSPQPRNCGLPCCFAPYTRVAAATLLYSSFSQGGSENERLGVEDPLGSSYLAVVSLPVRGSPSLNKTTSITCYLRLNDPVCLLPVIGRPPASRWNKRQEREATPGSGRYPPPSQ